MKRKRGEGTVTKRKDGRYEAAAYVSTTLGRRRVRRYAETRSDAEAILVELRKMDKNGILTSTREQRVGEYLDYWLKLTEPRIRRSTYESYETTARLYLKPALGSKSLIKLNPQDVQNYLIRQIEKGISVRNIQKQKIVLSAALKRAQIEGLVLRNSASLAQIPKYQPAEISPWTMNQLVIFLEQAKTDPFYPVFLFLSIYGLRTSEALGLSWRNIDFETNVIHVRHQLEYYDKSFHYADLKTQAARRDLPMLNITREALRNLDKSNSGLLPELVFKSSTSNPIFRRNLLRTFKRISKSVDLPDIPMHHLRHTIATVLKDMGIQARDTQSLLGHAHISTTQQIYQHSGLAQSSEFLVQFERKLVAESASSRQIQPSSIRTLITTN